MLLTAAFPTFPIRRPRPRSPRTKARVVARSAGIVITVAGLAVLLLVCADSMHALRQAGAFGGEGDAIRGVKPFVDEIRGSLVWLAGIFVGLVISVIAFMFLGGHSRAQDYLLKVGVAMVLLAGAGGIVN